MPDGGETFIASRGDARKRKAGGASDGDKEDSTWPRAFFDPDHHGQPDIHLPESRTMAGGGES